MTYFYMQWVFRFAFIPFYVSVYTNKLFACIMWTLLLNTGSTQFSGIKYIHFVVEPLPPSIPLTLVILYI